MKSISISITQNSLNDCIIDDGLFQYILGIAAKEYDYLNIVWIYQADEPDFLFFRRTLLFQQRTIRAKGITIRNTIRLLSKLPSEKLMRFCRKKKIALETEFDDCKQLLDAFATAAPKKICDVISVTESNHNELMSIYSMAKRYCKIFKLRQNFIYYKKTEDDSLQRYTASLKQLFDYWLNDTEGISVKPFTDHIKSVFGIAAEKECINSSCLERTLDIDSGGDMRICSRAHSELLRLGNVKNFSSFSEIFAAEVFTGIVSKMIEKRRLCIDSCQHFGFCQGGCCMCICENGNCESYCGHARELDAYIAQTINVIIKAGNELHSLNPALSDIIKEVIAYNPAMLMEREEQKH